MALKLSKDFKELEKQIRKDVHAAVEETLQDEVFEVVRDVVLERVGEDVYGVYTPTVYKRRRDDKGLKDKDKVVQKLGGNATEKECRSLFVWNAARYNPYNPLTNAPYFPSREGAENLQKLIIDGYKGYKGNDPPYYHPRPFIEKASEALDGDDRGKLEKAFENGLGKRGLIKK